MRYGLEFTGTLAVFRNGLTLQIFFRYPLPALIGGFTAIILLILYGLNRWTHLDTVDELLLGEARSTLESLRESVSEPSNPGLAEVLAALSFARSQEGSAAIIDAISARGVIVASTRNQRIGRIWTRDKLLVNQAMPFSLSSRLKVSLDPSVGRIQGYARLLINAGNKKVHAKGAFLYYERDVALLRKQALGIIDNTILREAFGIAIMVFIGTTLLQFVITRRVEHLESSMKRFKSGDWDARNRLSGHDAIARIGECVDQLLDVVVQDRADLGHSEARIKAVLETATDGIVGIDARGLILSINSAAERIFGYPKSELIGRNVNMLMPEPFHGQHDRFIENYLTTAQAKIIGSGREVLGLRSDGSIFPMELAVSEVRIGNERNFTGIVRDISQRKRTEEQLRFSREQLRLTFENAPVAILTSDLDCRILEANRASSQTIGYSREELLGMRFTDLVHPDERAKCSEFARQARLDQLGSEAIQQRWIHKNGNEIFGFLHIGVIHDQQGIPQHFVIQMEDNTDKLNAEAEARQLRERIAHAARITTLGEMVAGIAHEINQPLAAIASYMDASQRLLASGQASPEDLGHAMKQASTQAHRAAEVIQRLRGFAKMRSPHTETLDLNGLIREVVALAEMENPDLRAMIRLECADDLPKLRVDPIQIQQVILNLIRNAVDAIKETALENPRLTIRSVNEAGSAVRIEVIDCGSGIDEANADKIFDPFFSTKRSGMGLGLSIGRSIARAHGGVLDFKNNEGRGATFYLRLPT